jgi:two-component system, OmpR family, response regulator RegX3
MKVLLVDPDLDLLDVTAYALRRDGFDVITAVDGLQALQRWRADGPDVVVLDVDLPRLSEFEVCRQIREAGPTPVILLSASHTEEGITQGFRLGADDYVRKPFSPRELAMRIRAIWRRVTGSGAVEPVRELRIGDLRLNFDSHEIQVGDSRVGLTPLEFRLLQVLATNEGRVISAVRLADHAWAYTGGDPALLKSHISHIRRKMRSVGSTLVDIRPVRSVGYRLIQRSPGSGTTRRD